MLRCWLSRPMFFIVYKHSTESLIWVPFLCCIIIVKRLINEWGKKFQTFPGSICMKNFLHRKNSAPWGPEKQVNKTKLWFQTREFLGCMKTVNQLGLMKWWRGLFGRIFRDTFPVMMSSELWCPRECLSLSERFASLCNFDSGKGDAT